MEGAVRCGGEAETAAEIAAGVAVGLVAAEAEIGRFAAEVGWTRRRPVSLGPAVTEKSTWLARGWYIENMW